MSEYAPPRGKPVDIGEYGIHVLSFSSGPAVVCLHGGMPGSTAYNTFKHSVQTITGADHRAVLVDMLGFGYSSKPAGVEYDTKLLADTASAALEKLGIPECIVLGDSLGGAVGLRMALDYPDVVYELILVAPSGIETPETYAAMPAAEKIRDASTSGGFDRGELRKVMEALVHDKALITDEVVAERYAALEGQPADTKLLIPSMETEISNLQCPVYSFWGEHDELHPVSGAAKFAGLEAGSKFTIFPDCGHLVTLEKTAAFNAELERILNGDIKPENGHSASETEH